MADTRHPEARGATAVVAGGGGSEPDRRLELSQVLAECGFELLLVLDRELVVRHASPAMQRLLELSPSAEEGGVSFDGLVAASERELVRRQLVQLATEPGSTAELTARIRRANGDLRRVELVARNLLADERVAGIVLGIRAASSAAPPLTVDRHRDCALNVVAFANEQLLRTARWERVIDDVLARLGETLGALQVAVRRRTGIGPGDGDGMTFTWASPGIEPQPELLDNAVRDAGTTDGDDTLLCGRGASVATFPITSGSATLGWLQVCHARAEWEWPAIDLEAGRAVARALGAAFLRQAAEQRLRLLENAVENLPIGITITDAGGRIVYTNPADAAMHGYAVEELVGATAREVMAPSRMWASSTVEDMARSTPRRRESLNLRRDGSPFPVQLTSVVVLDDESRPIGLVTCCEDISERKAIEDALRRSEREHRGLIENAHDAILIVSPDDGTILEANQRACDAFGGEQGDLVGTRVTDITRDPRETRRIIRETLDRGTCRGVAVVRPKGGGDDIIVEVNASLVSYRDRPALLTINRDVTRRVRAEHQLKESREELRRLAEHLQKARENERMEVARTIHDELGQVLTALKMDVALARRRLRRTPEQAETKLDEMNAIIDAAIATVQRLATDLRPSILDNLGLASAVEWLLGDFRSRTGISCTLEIDPADPELGGDIATTVFRIVQESLNNVARHSNADHVELSLTANDEVVRLVVRDNGDGIAAEKLDHPASLGLIGIRERARNLGGDVEITGFPGMGTSVVAIVPTNGRSGRENDPSPVGG